MQSFTRDFSSLPIIDLSEWTGSDGVNFVGLAERLDDVARKVGFFYLTGHHVRPALFDDLMAASRAFFALSHADKMKVYIGLSRNHRGYVPEGEEVFAGGSKDKKEAFDSSIDLPADDPDAVGNPLLGPNQWPELPGFSTTVVNYYQAVFELGRTLMRGFSVALGKSAEHFDPLITKPPSQLRLVHYPFDPDAHDSVGIGAHTDYECFTLLHATAPGLEVLSGNGRWIDAPPMPGAFIVNIGDMMEILSNGIYVATSHRVRRISAERYSFPLFFALDYHAEVVPLERFVTPERPARGGLVSGEHLFAQTLQSFVYQRARLARGDITLPERAVQLSSFGQEARLNSTGV